MDPTNGPDSWGPGSRWCQTWTPPGQSPWCQELVTKWEQRASRRRDSHAPTHRAAEPVPIFSQAQSEDYPPALAIDPANRWWKAIVELTRLAAGRCEGRFLLSTIDTHSNLDCLSALRGPQQLSMDLIECPQKVLRALAQIDALYKPVYDALYEAGRMREFGTTSWLEMWSEGRTQAIQCDFACMISREHFRKFAMPSLEHEMSCLDHVVYHMDGPGQIRHLDDLLALPRLHTIQWVPGAGQPPAPAWIDLLQGSNGRVRACRCWFRSKRPKCSMANSHRRKPTTGFSIAPASPRRRGCSTGWCHTLELSNRP